MEPHAVPDSLDGFPHLHGGGSPGGPGVGSCSTAWKIESSSACAHDAASPGMIRRTAGNRFANQLASHVSGESVAPRSERLQTHLPPSPITPLASRRPSGPPGERRTHGSDGGVAGRSDCSRRDARQGKNGSEAVRSAAAVNCHCCTAHLVIETILHGRADQISRRRRRQHARGRVVFPRRRTGA